MDGKKSLSRLRERPSSRAGSVASVDTRYTSFRSRNSSLLPHSIRSDGSVFYSGEASTLSRAVLHTTDDDDEASNTIRDARPGWHRQYRHTDEDDDDAESEIEEEEEEERVKDGELDAEGGEEQVRRGKRSQHGTSTKSSSFHLPPFHRHIDSASMSADSTSGSYLAHSPPHAGTRRSYTQSLYSELGGTGSIASSLVDFDGGSSYPNSNSRAFRATRRHSVTSQGSTRGDQREDSSLNLDGSLLHRRDGGAWRPPLLAATSVAVSSAASRPASSLTASSSDVVGGGGLLSSKSGGGSSSSPWSRRSAATLDETGDVAGRLLSPAKGSTAEATADTTGQHAVRADGANRQLSLDSPFPAYSHASDLPCSTCDSAPVAEDDVWPFTQPIEVRLIRTQVRRRVEWNHSMRQFLLLIPLIFLLSFLVAVKGADIYANSMVTEALRQRFLRVPFPSAATGMELFRQQKALGLPVSVRTDRLFNEIHTQTDWMDFFVDVVMPGVFPDLATTFSSDLERPQRCESNMSAQRSSDEDACFSDGHFWWDKPGCAESFSDEKGVFADTSSRTTLVEAQRRQRHAALTRADTAAINLDTSAAAAAAAGVGEAAESSSSSSSSTSCYTEASLVSPEMLVGPAQNIYLGAMRVRTIRMRPHSAKLQRRLYPDNTQQFPFDAWSRHHDRAEEETTPTRCPSITLQDPLTNASTPLYTYRPPEANDPYCDPTVGRFGKYHCGGYTVDVPFRVPSWRAAEYREAMRNASCFFVDNWATRLVIVEFFTYTPEHDSFHLVKLRSEVLAGGAYYNEAVFRDFRVWTPHMNGELVFVSFTLAYVAVYCVFLLLRLRWQVRLEGWASTAQDVSAWMDVSLVTSTVVSVAYYYAWVRLSKKVAPHLALPMDSDVYPSYLDSVQRLSDLVVTCGALSVILCYTRLFFFRTLFRPFSTILTALNLSLPTLVATSVVLLVLAIGYALAAHAVFGPVSEYYTTFGEALYTVLSFWYSTSLVIPPGEAAAQQFTGFFFWSLTIVLFGVVVALYIAIVSHSFFCIEAVYGVTYDGQWMARRLKAFGRCCTWTRLRWFVGKMIFVYPESDYLFSLLESMNAAYFDDGAASSQTQRGQDKGDALLLRRAESDVTTSRAAAVPWGNSVHTDPLARHDNPVSSSTKSSSAYGKPKRLDSSMTATIVDGQSVEQGSSASLPLAREERSGIGTAQTSIADSNPTPPGAAAQPRSPAATAFSAVKEANPLSLGRHNLAALSPASRLLPEPRRRAAKRFNNPVRRTSDELREMHDELRELTTLSRRITFFDWCEVIPHDVFVKCGGMQYFKDWWMEITEAQADVSRTPQQQARRDFREKVAFATEREVAGGIVGIGRLENTLTQLELHVDSLLQNVSKR